MHPTQHRGLRELFAMTRRLRNHWRTLAQRIDPIAPQEAELLRGGADLAGALLAELTDVAAARGLYGKPLAQGFGARLAYRRHMNAHSATTPTGQPHDRDERSNRPARLTPGGPSCSPS